ncbi:MAG: hypothetical protein COY69_02045 [Candidatus Magasanikbacteria bacterium CG_4_10_14_0_8_um_filter_32_14]|uniref:TrbC/VIRB2 family protein n=2 Tax=Candidatus Magasanikiibacteriota TaxID=1752731 RepID=A0A2M7R9E8_9BACT|nr:MAG: hypothetical protein AUJ23_02745 [Candidatus Magasanikbacteria bacterium CG1_02_32_51]PIY93360.1 MAG: hypothetical protein COY69_02045 [Candidatus Magasanikbacteria bacterium CG_4_10_14_0_8_um_filter_32_14]
MKNKKIWQSLIVFLFIFSFLLFGYQAFAANIPTCDRKDDPLGLDCVKESSGLSDADPRIIIVKIINVSLGLLGIIATVLIIYSGFLWMTSGGEQTKVDKARKIIFSAIIGLVIILMAFAITRYVSASLFEATTGNVYPTGSYYYY